MKHAAILIGTTALLMIALDIYLLLFGHCDTVQMACIGTLLIVKIACVSVALVIFKMETRKRRANDEMYRLLNKYDREMKEWWRNDR